MDLSQKYGRKEFVEFSIEFLQWKGGRTKHGKKPNVLGSNEQNLAKLRTNFRVRLLAKLLRFSEI